VAFLVETLRAADWAAANEGAVRDVLARETGSGALGVDIAFSAGFNQHLEPDLSVDRLDLFRKQKDFLLRYGFLASDIDVQAWAAPEYLELAREQLAEGVGA
jgi:ABC-type nitrate/sulfonate/bicarbonate transport system substrate-binding protein